MQTALTCLRPVEDEVIVVRAGRWDNETGTTWLLRGVNDPMEGLAVGRARCEFRAILENDDVLAVKPRLELLDAIHVHNRRAVHADEAVRREPLLEPCQRVTYHMHVAARMKLSVLAIGFDPVDFARLQKRHLAPGPDHEPVDRPLIEE